MFPEPLAANSSQGGGYFVSCSQTIPQSPDTALCSHPGLAAPCSLGAGLRGAGAGASAGFIPCSTECACCCLPPRAAHLRGRAGRSLLPYQMGHEENILFLLLKKIILILINDGSAGSYFSQRKVLEEKFQLHMAPLCRV